MKTKIILTTVLVAAYLFFSFKLDEKVKGWFLSGSNPSEYEIGVEQSAERNGKVAFLKSKTSKVKSGFGTIMQTFDADMYLDKKVKLTGFIKSNDVNGWAGMWMRVDDSKGSVSFDNMQDRSIKGTTEWKKYEIVLSVPKNSKTINYGVLLSGGGEVWMDNLSFEVVGDAEEKTGKTRLKAPTKANFEN
ncbi:MAG: hypothetical protein ACJAV5_000754 [Vicingaceae bacterium]|jgi:hypothetical protein